MALRRYSIVQDNLTECLVCKDTRNIHIHHCFGGANRIHSERNHLIVALCARHHNGSNFSAHMNRTLDLKIKHAAQEAFEKTHTREEFIAIFGKSWL